MFHVCVKVVGVGVQDFRFLCPNGTAFDQEAQICADWGDVDCEQSVLYYGSDNFDLYRIGSGFESKRAPLAEEDEAVFHLQRAESADIRRSKETRVDQKSRPDQPPNYTKHFEATTRNSFNNYANLNTINRNQQQVKKNSESKTSIVNFYTPTTSTTTTTTERYNDDSKQDLDDIFKGSHSSHFFANRNGGREDDFVDVSNKIQANDFTDYNKKTEQLSNGKTRLQPARSRRIQSTTQKPITTSTTTTLAPVSKITKKLTLQTSFNTDFVPYTPTTTTSTTSRPSQSNLNRYSFSSSDYPTQEKIEPTTYNPANSIYRYKVTTPKYTEFSRDNFAAPKTTKNEISTAVYEQTAFSNKPTISSRKSQQRQQKVTTQNSTFTNQNEFNEFSKIKVQQPQPFQPSKVFTAPTLPQKAQRTLDKPINNYVDISRAAVENTEPQYFRSRTQQVQPAPFSSPQKQQQRTSTTAPEETITKTAKQSSPRGFASRGSINYKATTQRNGDSNYTPASNVKKFSTLVPREQYTPTTYKPTTYKQSNDYNYYQTQQTVRPTASKQQQKSPAVSSISIPTTANPYYNPDEDDGQYHPELYELDYTHNRFNLQRSTSTKATTTTTSTTKAPNNHKQNYQNPQTHLKTQQLTSFQKQREQHAQSDQSDEDELFNTAHSLNFGAASINKLRADIIKAEKTSQQYNSQYSPNIQTSSPKAISTVTQKIETPSTNAYTYPIYTTTTTTSKPISVTTQRTTTTTVAAIVSKPSKSSGKSGKKGKKSHKKATSKRPAHADEDTSYDYAYYDSDTLSESPQEYPEYEISEFTRTRKN
ncbi:serine-rich adhesin for platelets-like [Teleopsis dalmanni]|uniref:serine-rich adhesin for platelets-like n=1 Tax=Teleopsis dalmanni TaxID=139649 RepID=UPI0018CD51AF|nr:serine-rich adhesin for platelets-like [Teleopsis dalmanni]